MSNDINLLRSQKKRFQESQKILFYFQVVAMSSLVLVVLSSLILFILQMQSPLTRLQQEEESLIATINRMQNKTARLLLIQNRSDAITSILKKRVLPHDTISMLLKNMPFDTEVEAVTIDAKEFVITTSSSSLSSLGVFVDNIVSENVQKKIFKKIILTSAVYNASKGRYVLSLEGERL